MLWTDSRDTDWSDQYEDRQSAPQEQALRRYLAERCPHEDDLQYCERRVAEEDRLARDAGSPEAGLIHEQTAMLYRAQLNTLRLLHRR